MKRIFSIIMEYGLGLPTGTIAFWGTLVPRILTVDYTFNNSKHFALTPTWSLACKQTDCITAGIWKLLDPKSLY